MVGGFLSTVGEIVLLVWHTLAACLRRPPQARVVLDQLHEVGVRSLSIVNLTAIFTERRKLASQLQAQKRFDAAQTTLPAGWKGLSIAQGTLGADRYCPTTTGFGLTTSQLERFVGLDWTWDEDDGKVLYKALDGSDAVEARFKAYHQLVAPTRNCHVKLTLAAPTF